MLMIQIQIKTSLPPNKKPHQHDGAFLLLIYGLCKEQLNVVTGFCPSGTDPLHGRIDDLHGSPILPVTDNDGCRQQHRLSVNTIEKRLKACKCELCGTTDSPCFEIHHINKLKNLKGKLPWEVAMIAKRRKTLVVCHNCHVMIHHQ